MHSVKCNLCGRVFTHRNASVCRANLGNHMRSHGIESKKSLAAKKREAKLVGNSPQESSPVRTEERVFPSFCPSCGCNLRPVMVALNLKAK